MIEALNMPMMARTALTMAAGGARWVIPSLADCAACGAEPFEFQCIIAPAERADKTAGGIILTDDTKEKDNYGAERARLVAVSPLAFDYAREWPPGTRFPQPGDVVLTSKYAGQAFEGQDGKTYRICTDKDIKAVIERAGG